MEKRVEESIIALLAGYQLGSSGGLSPVADLDQHAAGLYSELKIVFKGKADFRQKLKALDATFDLYPDHAPLRELAFDLLLINFMAFDVEDQSDYLESPEWEKIEEETLDRGTELLNVFLYLQECAEMDIPADLSDFLKEFLLVEDDDFQEECEVYEEVIANQALVESSYEQIRIAASKLKGDSPVNEIFYPLMSFFYEPLPSFKSLEDFYKQSLNKPFDCSVLFAILVYYAGIDKIPVNISV